MRGDGAAVPHENFEALLHYFTKPSETESLGYFLPVVSQALKHFGVRDPETAEFIRAWYGNDDGDSVKAMLRLVDGHPRQAVHAMVHAVKHGGDIAQRLIPALLDAGVPTETLVRDRETLLHYAVREKNPYAVAQLLLVGADQTARNAEGWTAAEMAMKLVVDTLDSDEGAWRMRVGDHGWVVITAPQEILQLLWPEAAAQWLAMSEAERRATAARS